MVSIFISKKPFCSMCLLPGEIWFFVKVVDQFYVTNLMVQRVEVESISVTKIWPKSSSSMALLSVHCCPTIQTPTHSPIPTTYTSGHPPVHPTARPPTHSKNQRSDNLVFCNNNLPLIVSLWIPTKPHIQTPTNPPNHPPTQPLGEFSFLQQ